MLVLLCVTLDSISAAVLTTSSCFARSLVSSLVVFFMPPPRAPIMTGTIVTVYPGLLSLISKASCRYRVSLSVRFVSMFCCIGHAMLQIQICFSFFSSSIKSGLLAVSVFFKLNWKLLLLLLLLLLLILLLLLLLSRKNLAKWGISTSSECSFCLHPETLLHVVAGCSSYLNRFTWRHDSILNFIANNIPLQNFQNIFADLPGFSNPSIITGDKHRPDLLLTTKDNCLYILELTVGYETNLRNNIKRKQTKYAALIQDQMNHFKTVKFVNLSVSALGVFDQESSPFIEMLRKLNVDNNHQKYVIRKIINIAIRSTYYIFCCRDKEWSNPDLMTI